MKHVILPICILLCGLVGVSISAETQSLAKPEWVREVLDGKRGEARVSWWGFDAKDATEILQSAINSKARKLIIDRQASAWITRPLTGVNNQEIVFRGIDRLSKKNRVGDDIHTS